VQRLRRLATRRTARLAERAFVVEGPTLVLDACDAGVTVESAYVDADADSEAVTTAVERLDRAGVAVYDVAGGVLARVGGAVTPQGIAAVVGLGSTAIDTVLADAGRSAVVVVLAGVADPGNAGTLLRTAEAAGAWAVVVAGESADPFAPKVVRASAGSVFRIPIAVEPDAGLAIERVASLGLRLIGLASGAGARWYDADLSGPLALVLGNEAHGLPETVAAAIDEWVNIPMAGRVESLNVATAGAVVLFEAAHQRDQTTGRARSETAGCAPNA
jgi:RNA methyltransferase, TrmH family